MNKNIETSFSCSFLNLGTDLLESGHLLDIKTTGESMFPEFRPGDIVRIKKESSFNINKGDVVVYKTDKCFIAHRVIKKFNIGKELYFITKGDSNRFRDNPINYNNILGKIIIRKRNNKIICFDNINIYLRNKIIALLSLYFPNVYNIYIKAYKHFLTY
ncbi:MAG: signal peptidase I [Bacteroidota bacterium]|nr:signal peptidase I [Bacteroidota bacterium]